MVNDTVFRKNVGFCFHLEIAVKPSNMIYCCREIFKTVVAKVALEYMGRFAPVECHLLAKNRF